MRDPYFANAQADAARRPEWKPKARCADCGLMTGTYSRIAGRPWCALCAPAVRRVQALRAHLTDERKP